MVIVNKLLDILLYNFPDPFPIEASDIIASRTYNYFLPLIFVALIYLIITFILSRLVSAMEKRLKV